MKKNKLMEKSSLPMSNDDFKVVFENAEWKIVIPKTFAASVKWGKHTAWDTANPREGEQYFNYYNERGPLVIIINKITKEKYQYHKDEGLFDAMDREMSFSDIPEEIVAKVTGINENKRKVKMSQKELINFLSEAVEKKLKTMLLKEDGIKSINDNAVEVLQMIDNGMFDDEVKKYVVNGNKETFEKLAQRILKKYNITSIIDTENIKRSLFKRRYIVDSQEGNRILYKQRQELDNWDQHDRDWDMNDYIQGHEIYGSRKPRKDITSDKLY